MQSAAKTEGLNQKQGKPGSQYGAKHIRQVQIAEGPRGLRAHFLLDREHGEGKRGAHAGAPWHQRQRNPDSCHQIKTRGRKTVRFQPLQQLPAPGQLKRNHQRRNADQQFGQGVETRKRQPFFPLPYQMSGTPRAESKPQHENRENQRDQRGGDSVLRHGQPQPDHFVENAAEARHQKKEKIPLHAAGSRVGTVRIHDGSSRYTKFMRRSAPARSRYCLSSSPATLCES